MKSYILLQQKCYLHKKDNWLVEHFFGLLVPHFHYLDVGWFLIVYFWASLVVKLKEQLVFQTIDTRIVGVLALPLKKFLDLGVEEIASIWNTNIHEVGVLVSLSENMLCFFFYHYFKLKRCFQTRIILVNCNFCFLFLELELLLCLKSFLELEELTITMYWNWWSQCTLI